MRSIRLERTLSLTWHTSRSFNPNLKVSTWNVMARTLWRQKKVGQLLKKRLISWNRRHLSSNCNGKRILSNILALSWKNSVKKVQQNLKMRKVKTTRHTLKTRKVSFWSIMASIFSCTPKTLLRSFASCLLMMAWRTDHAAITSSTRISTSARYLLRPIETWRKFADSPCAKATMWKGKNIPCTNKCRHSCRKRTITLSLTHQTRRALTLRQAESKSTAWKQRSMSNASTAWKE